MTTTHAVGRPLTPPPARRRRLALGAALAALAAIGVVGVPSAASADPPVGTCPGPFELRAISDFSPGTQEFLRASIDRNGDGRVCATPLPEAIPFLNISFIDNLAQG